MTAKEKRILEAYLCSDDHQLSDVYGRCSQAKQDSFIMIEREMYENCGSDLRILSHNSNFYTCAYIIKGKGFTKLVYHTHTRKQVIDI